MVEIILEALRTPSESVQRSCGQCLAPLAKRLSGDREYAAQLVDRLAAIAVASDSYADRRGAAFGLAGVVRGLGLVSLKQLNLMTRLVDKFESKKDVTGKEGALYSFAALTGAGAGNKCAVRVTSIDDVCLENREPGYTYDAVI